MTKMHLATIQLVLVGLLRLVVAHEARDDEGLQLETHITEESIHPEYVSETNLEPSTQDTQAEELVHNETGFTALVEAGENDLKETLAEDVVIETTETMAMEAAPTEEESEEIQFYNFENRKYPNVEHLDIKPLNENNMLVSFNFELNGTTELYPSQNQISYFDVFPKSLGTILKSVQARELHIRFGHGWYDSEVNGKLVSNGSLSGGTGVELWAEIEADSKEEAFANWIQLANSLSGMFCASFNFIDSSITTTPEKLFNSEVDLESQVALKGRIYRFRSALPREPICTENLTPFLRLLPTKGKQGISSLLSGNKMFNAEWSSMSIDITTDCESGDIHHCQQTMKQSINLILNIPKVLAKNKNPLPVPTPGSELRCDTSKIHDIYNCFPLPPSNEYEFSLFDLFGKGISGGSLIASKPTSVCLDVDLENWEVAMISLAPIKENYQGSKLCFNLDTNANYNINFKTKDGSLVNPVEQPPFYASRSLSGYSQDSGGFRLDLFNPLEEYQNIVIFETLPWYVKLYLHSMTLTITNDNGESKVLGVHDAELSSYIREIIYNPAVDRVAPTHLELLIAVPPKTKLKFSFKFDKAMLLYSEYPPDANHGFEIEPTVFASINDDNKIQYIMRTTTSLLTLPTPDFSMPYNVIIMTLTVMSLFFGSIFNLMVKKTVTEEEAEFLRTQKPLEKIKAKLRGMLRK